MKNLKSYGQKQAQKDKPEYTQTELEVRIVFKMPICWKNDFPFRNR